ncbi:MAG: sigma-70 family RNA polymerase sigma factor [Planctomycetota bacterium]
MHQPSDNMNDLDLEASSLAGETPTLLQRVASGDPEAMDHCVDRYGDLVWSLANRFRPTHADAEDVVQEVFVQLWQQADRFDPTIATETTFVAMIARRRLIDHQRRQARRPATTSESNQWAIAMTNTPLEDAEHADDAAKAARCMDGLTDAQRSVLMLAVSDGCSHRMIADQLTIPLGTVKSHARRALVQLRLCMGLDQAAELTGNAS